MRKSTANGIFFWTKLFVPSDGVGEALHVGGDVFQIPNRFARLEHVSILGVKVEQGKYKVQGQNINGVGWLLNSAWFLVQDLKKDSEITA